MERIGIVGCGLMGSGIAEVTARAGAFVTVIEADDEAQPIRERLKLGENLGGGHGL